ncbi:MAG: hypothetical protein JWM78_926 [Verrucomicrobiaceae bacterium]|nr:hypothetical protein [Verrucomicrobiaceae bacterium]
MTTRSRTHTQRSRQREESSLKNANQASSLPAQNSALKQRLKRAVLPEQWLQQKSVEKTGTQESKLSLKPSTNEADEHLRNRSAERPAQFHKLKNAGSKFRQILKR